MTKRSLRSQTSLGFFSITHFEAVSFCSFLLNNLGLFLSNQLLQLFSQPMCCLSLSEDLDFNFKVAFFIRN